MELLAAQLVKNLPGQDPVPFQFLSSIEAGPHPWDAES